MTRTTVSYSSKPDSAAVSKDLADQIKTQFEELVPNALIVFASPKYDYNQLLEGLKKETRAEIIVGCSSAGEFTTDEQGEGAASAMALWSNEMQFHPGFATNVKQDPKKSAKELLNSFRGLEDEKFIFKSALVLTDALAGYVDEMLEDLTLSTGGSYRFFGGGAGDDAKFSTTHVFCDTRVESNAVVALEILSNKPLGIGVRHGWQPSSEAYRVTASEGMRLISLNATPAADVFAAYAMKTNQQFDRADPVPFFLHNVLGIQSGDDHKLRVPLAVGEDGSVTCAAEISTGSIVHIMKATSASSANAAEEATRDAIGQLNGAAPSAALFFDCVATRLRMGKEFGLEMDSLRSLLKPAKYAGCNTYGQIARSDGQFSGFHNCTAVVCIIPE
jgi:hypothetical protein